MSRQKLSHFIMFSQIFCTGAEMQEQKEAECVFEHSDKILNIYFCTFYELFFPFHFGEIVDTIVSNSLLFLELFRCFCCTRIFLIEFMLFSSFINDLKGISK